MKHGYVDMIPEPKFPIEVAMENRKFTVSEKMSSGPVNRQSNAHCFFSNKSIVSSYLKHQIEIRNRILVKD